jgi:hypothetical protein
MPKKKWTKETYRLPKDHGWRSKPGYQIFVADRGALRFDVPRDWFFEPGESSFRFFDRQPPDDDCRLEVSIMRLNPQIDWSGLPLAEMLEESTKNSPFPEISRGEIVHVKRDDLELVWYERRFVDPVGLREARSRACLALGSNVAPLITMDFWPEDAKRVTPVWDEVLRSLQLGMHIKDPFRRDVH